jgi:S1-C subfamily serine protease
MRHPPTILLAFSFLTIAWHPLSADDRPRFEAVLTGGARIEGQTLQEWHKAPPQPKLDGRPLFDPGSPLVWLRDRKVRPGGVPKAFVEMTNGDRLPGEVLAFRAAGVWDDESLPAHFLVRTPVGYRHTEDGRPPVVRVAERFVRRIVWQRQFAGNYYEPGTVSSRDGSVAKFRALRFDADAARILQESGTRKASFGEIAELHLANRDPWQSYYDELAAVNPDLQARMLQVETSGGLIATASTARFDAHDGGDGNNSDRWLHALQPAWSLDLLWVRRSTIWIYRSFVPHQVPLSRIAPSRIQARGLLGGAWPWQANRSVEGGLLQSGKQGFGWGLGVHAFSQLHFPLPAAVQKFRTRVGLDETAGGGGCVRVRVYGGSMGEPPLYESPFMVGSDKTLDVGPLPLKGPAQGQKELILQVDPAHDGRPPGADPFDVRDMLDWLEPELELDPAALKAEVGRPHRVDPASWEGWQVLVEKDAAIGAANVFDKSGPDRGAFLTTIRAEKQPFVLRRMLQVEPDQHWLLISASLHANSGDNPKLQVRIDGRPMAEYMVPVSPNPRSEPVLMAFPLSQFQGHAILVELAQTPGDPRSAVFWRHIRMAEQTPGQYCVLGPQTKPVALDPESKGTAEMIDDDYFGRKQVLKVTPGGRFRIATFQPPLSLRNWPPLGNYQMLHCVLHKQGKGRVSIELEHENSEKQPLVYDLGKGPPSRPEAKQAFPGELPEEWTVIDRHLTNDFGERAITGIVVSVPDGEAALLANLCVVWPSSMPLPFRDPAGQWSNRQVRSAVLDAVQKRVLPLTVLVESDGHSATGVLVRNEGHVLTAGHMVVKPGREATVTLPDGRKLKAVTAGVDRAADLGLVKVAEKTGINGAEIGEWNPEQSRLLCFGVAYPLAGEKRKPQIRPLPIRQMFGDTIWGGDDSAGLTTGGLLVNCDASVVGLQTQHSRFGGGVFTRGQPIRANTDRMIRNEVWGQWALGSGPMLPVTLVSGLNECRVAALAADAPAGTELKPGDVLEALDGKPLLGEVDLDRALADKNPGDEVQLGLNRNGKKLQVKVRLLPRRP